MMASSASGEQFTPPVDRTWKPHLQIAPNCPRCASSNTKFCYYNNYSLSQPRYFCKACRRYWTKGGSLRNVPVGGGCRKTRRSGKSSRPAAFRARPLPLDSNDRGGTCSGDSSSSSADRGGSDIDMAVVFAKFLNPDLAAPVEEAGLTDRCCGVSNSNSNSISSTPESGMMTMMTMSGGEEEGTLFPPAGSCEFGDIFGDDHPDELKRQEVMGNGFGLQTLVSDEMAALWSMTAAAEAEAWELPPEQPEFDAGDWNSYDLQQLQGSFDISPRSLAKPSTNYY